MRIENLSLDECKAVLAQNRLARLACCRNNKPYVVAIYYAYANESLFAFSVPGKKIDWMRANPLVSVLVEQHGDGHEWCSVVIDGRFEELPDRIGYKREREHAYSLLSKHSRWWEPGELKPVFPPPPEIGPPVFFRISIDSMSGRRAKE